MCLISKLLFSSFGYFLPPKSSLLGCSILQENFFTFRDDAGMNSHSTKIRNAICLITDAVCIHIKYLREKNLKPNVWNRKIVITFIRIETFLSIFQTCYIFICHMLRILWLRIMWKFEVFFFKHNFWEGRMLKEFTRFCKYFFHC